MTTDTDHDVDTCPHPSWCLAHGPMCDCAYSNVHPHRAAGCRYNTDDQDQDDEQ